jgi:hypothetical protein
MTIEGGEVKTLARSQTWTRNITKKKKGPTARGASRPAKLVAGDDALESIKRRAEDLGLILHARPRGGKKTGGK